MTQLADKDLTETFWDRIEDTRTGMLVIDGRAVPMSHYVDENKRDLWFITAKGTYMAEHAKGANAHFVLCNDNKGLYASLSGRLTAEMNKEKLDEYWSFIAASWYEDGKQDPDVLLLKLSLDTGEVWTSKGGPKFFYEIAKANLTDEKPDIGEHFEISF
ncbi:pyridoxamine 5'-phosphate oxidase family protein [Hyphomonas sp.]|jgi:general stress protein 26|uniref:pyridoxamine 5'-phosphate oxidase family protein n=1 Tax=Hyphomonas sp. TaxID=87 RepID=UPI000C4386B0|nr:general stress protein [Hyphomonadaceae bacterium]|tara:strand:+ start:2241 stop:2717 length:477 start_codon:yes stop_codon:yes gene_type:complete